MKLFWITLLLATPLFAGTLNESIISYKIDGKEYEGFLVTDTSGSTNKPGVLIIHDWMGLTDKTKEKAREIAGLGYIAFAADIYGKGVRPKNTKEASELATSYKSNRTLYRKHLKAGLDTLKKQPHLIQKKIAAIGFCFGGTGVIELARSGVPILGAVSFHGGLDSPTPKDGKKIKAKILALHGADDPFVSEKDLIAFEKEMMDSKVDWQLIKYGGAVHSFTDKTAGTDNSKGAAYNEKADKRSWISMKEFFEEIF